ncbi:MAG: methanesulfonate monooxygenase subunit beta [Myxococcales bacterium]|nr:methanesulfonate monooxygenase subunit beta [Myxococcales bacterium]
MSHRPDIDEVIYRSALLLDARDFGGYLDLCAPEFRYLISAYSPEIRRDMIWLEHDRDGLKALFDTLPRHHSDPAPLARHLTVYTVAVSDNGGRADAVSALQVFRTSLDGGATELFGVGKIHDTLTLAPGRGDGVRLLKRHVKLETRMLGIGSHLPF